MILGILNCDTVKDEWRNVYGDYPEMFQKLLSANGNGISFTTYDTHLGNVPEDIDECDAYLITGSKKSVYHKQDWIEQLQNFVIALNESKKKLVGICFGHQLIAQALGGRTEKNKGGWGVGVASSRVYEKPGWMKPAVESFSLLVSHQDQVTLLPKGALLLAGDEFCPFAMFQVDEHVLAMQGHPEFSTGYTKTMMEYRKNILGNDLLNKGLASLNNEVHEIIVSKWIIHFLQAS